MELRSLWRGSSCGGTTIAHLHNGVTLALLTQTLQALGVVADKDRGARAAGGRRLGRLASAPSALAKGLLAGLAEVHLVG